MTVNGNRTTATERAPIPLPEAHTTKVIGSMTRRAAGGCSIGATAQNMTANGWITAVPDRALSIMPTEMYIPANGKMTYRTAWEYTSLKTVTCMKGPMSRGNAPARGCAAMPTETNTPDSFLKATSKARAHWYGKTAIRIPAHGKPTSLTARGNSR